MTRNDTREKSAFSMASTCNSNIYAPEETSALLFACKNQEKSCDVRKILENVF